MKLDHETLCLLAYEAGIPSPRKEHQTMTQLTTTSGTPLEHATLSQAPRHIPNEDGDVVKTELVLERSPGRTVKINWWWLPDNVGGRNKPHNHPWPFDSMVLHGWLKEVRYTPNGDGTYSVKELTHRAGDTYFMDSNEFHVVTDVGHGTVTRMVCGEAAPDNEWGYLDSPGTYVRATMDPDFMRRLWAVNPHLKKDYAVEFGVPGAPISKDPGILMRSEAVDRARTILASDDLNAGAFARVVEVSTGEVVWSSKP